MEKTISGLNKKYVFLCFYQVSLGVGINGEKDDGNHGYIKGDIIPPGVSD